MWCRLCRSQSHWTYACPKYPTRAAQKQRRLDQENDSTKQPKQHPAYALGVEAYRRGLSKEDCPFGMKSDRYWWLGGWNDADRDLV